AYAIESSSLSVREEVKRKIRIAAGGMQSIVALRNLLIPIRQPLLSLQYVSHRVLRWSITPFLLFAFFLSNAIIVSNEAGLIYIILWYYQVTFYGLALAGLALEKRKLKVKMA